MKLDSTVLSQKILEMSEGDEDFKIELTSAIHSGLLELRQQYSLGKENADLEIIQQIRHKVKPTLAMFDFDELSESLQEGKSILESEGFGKNFEAHFEDFRSKLDGVIEEVSVLKDTMN
ncbi:MAG: hypothetical protein HLUCCX10_09400 [Algoriphagus marincola HL-49]|uniref:HPt domain-containing protein n=1 Tax=Algoriphagus marincola HL-49 TaxID=1305737 RepID=A0A0P8AID6_9BACT|nr:MAG: hypothetical protein HLUCCX10_09400 [Algoriphagus marincola HL-49]